MKRILILLLEVVLIAAVGLIMYWNYRDKKAVYRPARLIVNTERPHFLTRDLEDNLVFFLTKQLGSYEGAFEIIEVVNLGTRELAGVDYVVMTIRAPDGKLCQVALVKNSYPWSKWEVASEQFKVEEPAKTLYSSYTKDTKWIETLGITPGQLYEYYIKHPQMTQEELESSFVDKVTGMHILPDDWRQSVTLAPNFSLEQNKERGFRFIANIAGDNSYDTYWKVDYPASYSGPGYRAYLYDKIEQNHK
ncbi:MAG: hypothetical protein FJZ08_00750 [Candidatus Omnitrophica bacterium]|nr:hypothetical protein [Candidatus Omnitrophota bacterium]